MKNIKKFTEFKVNEESNYSSPEIPKLLMNWVP